MSSEETNQDYIGGINKQVFETKGEHDTEGLLSGRELEYLIGDNSREYVANLEQGMDRGEAARQTWTGKLAAELGFTRVKRVDEAKDENGELETVEVWFAKDQR